MSDTEVMEARELPAGSIVNIGGIPVVLTGPVEVATHKGNWPLIEEATKVHLNQ